MTKTQSVSPQLSKGELHMRSTSFGKWKALLLVPVAMGVVSMTPLASAASPSSDRLRLVNSHSFDKRDVGPQVRITSPLDGDFIAPGDSIIGRGDPNGSGFAIVAEIVTRDSNAVSVDEGINIRNVKNLGGLNPQFPGLFVFIDDDLITPDGTIIPANTNLGPLFNIAGTDDSAGSGVTIWAGWHVLESIRPRSDDSVNLTVAVVDETGRIGFDRVKLHVVEIGRAHV